MFLYRKSNRYISLFAFCTALLIVPITTKAGYYGYDAWFWVRFSDFGGSENFLVDRTLCNGKDIVPPNTNPTPPPGYTFAGWTPAVNTSGEFTLPEGEPDSFEYHSSDNTNISDNGSSLASGGWSVTYSNAGITLVGTSLCSTTDCSKCVEGYKPDSVDMNGGGIYCFCRLLTFDDGRGVLPVVPAQWVFRMGFKDNNECEFYCAESCPTSWLNMKNAFLGKI